MEALLTVDPTTQESPFAVLCRPPGRASRKNLNALIERYKRLFTHTCRLVRFPVDKSQGAAAASGKR